MGKLDTPFLKTPFVGSIMVCLAFGASGCCVWEKLSEHIQGDIPNSVGRGLSCRCQDGFAGHIFWKGHEAFGSCTPAPCEIPFSNKEPGLKCECTEAYAPLAQP